MDYKFINPEYLDSVSGGDPDIILEIVTMFREQSLEITREMRSHYQNGNWKSLGALAHKAKSSVEIMGMSNLGSMLRTWEFQAKEGKNTELYDSYISRFSQETDAAVKELDDLVKDRFTESR